MGSTSDLSLLPFFLLGWYFYFVNAMQALCERLSQMPSVFQDGRSIVDMTYPWMFATMLAKKMPSSSKKNDTVQSLVLAFLCWWSVPILLLAVYFIVSTSANEAIQKLEILESNCTYRYTVAAFVLLSLVLAVIFNSKALETLHSRSMRPSCFSERLWRGMRASFLGMCLILVMLILFGIDQGAGARCWNAAVGVSLEFLRNHLSTSLLCATFLLMSFNGILGFPPSELVVGAAAAATVYGKTEAMVVLIFAVAGNVCGTTLLYGAARSMGRDWITRQRRWLTIRPYHLARLEKTFRTYGWWLVMIGRMVPGIRTQISIPAGLARMKLGVFLLATIIGCSIWVGICGAAGFVLADPGTRGSIIAMNLHQFIPLIVLLPILFLVVYRLAPPRELALKPTIGRRIAQQCLCLWIQIDLKRTLRELDDWLVSLCRQSPIRSDSQASRNARRPAWVSDHFVQLLARELVQTDRLEPLSESLRGCTERLCAYFVDAFQRSLNEKPADTNVAAYMGLSQIAACKELAAAARNHVKLFGINDWSIQKGPVNSLVESIRTALDQPSNSEGIRQLLSSRRGRLKFWRPRTKHYVSCFLGIIDDWISFIRNRQTDDGVVFRNDGEIKAYYNVMNLLLHQFVLHGRILLSRRDWELVWAVAALHPSQDDLLDRGLPPGPTDGRRLRQQLEGYANNTPGSYSSVASLVRVIYRHLSPQEHPDLVWIFTTLYDWQERSVQQNGWKNELKTEELLTISFMKGGLAFALYGYAMLGSVSIEQFAHFFSMGAIFQLMDDLHDVDEDFRAGTQTIWTSLVRRDEYFDQALGALFCLQTAYQDAVHPSRDLLYPGLARLVEIIGVKYDTFRFYCMNRDHFSPHLNECMDSAFGDISGVVSFFSNTREHENLDNYLSVLDAVSHMFRTAK